MQDSAYGGEDKEALGSMLTQLLQVLRSATGEDDTEEESEEEDEDEDGASVVGQLRPVKVCQLPLHPHVVAPVSDGTAFSSMQGFTSGWGCDMCRTPHRSNAGRWRCVEGCDFDSCESCIDRFGRCSLTLRQEISKALPGMATVGDVVVLTPDYIKYFDAVGGPLKPGLAGIVVEDDHTDRLPLRVATFFGAKWWYARGAVRIVGQRGDVVDNARAQLGVPVVRGPDWWVSLNKGW